ncbi:MAG: CDP-glucose 4,6-dehydratase [Bacteroidales bacterium]|jgi:CDP-glucose 4,6-dehydratase|nr:CDP-glucose 4,6-dehydratase [Bacteroidales bacterium]
MASKMKNFYKNKKVFITGHTGFKGGWLTEILHLWGAHVYGYSLPAEGKDNFFTALNISSKCKHITDDLRNHQALQAALLDAQPDIIFHLAAQPIVRTSYQIPIETFIVNAMGTANILQAMRSLDKRTEAVFITTDKVYKNLENGKAYQEDDPLGGYDPYSASKAAAEIVIQSFMLSFFNPAEFDKHKKSIVSVRAGNVIGGGDWADNRLLPDMMRAMHYGETVVLRNPAATRPWQHVLEPLNGYLLVGKAQYENPSSVSNAYNFGPNPQDVLTVEQIAKISGIPYIIKPEANAPHEANMLQLDITRAKKELGFKPRLSAAEAVAKTVEWYRAYYANDNTEALTRKQILEYFQN